MANDNEDDTLLNKNKEEIKTKEGDDEALDQGDRDTSEDPKWCCNCCCSLKIMLHLLAIYILFDVIYSIYQVYAFSTNETYADYYWIVYALFFSAYIVTFVFYSMFYCQKDHPNARSRLPFAILAAFIGSLLIFIWILVYSLAIYENDDNIRIGSGPVTPEGEEDNGNY